MIEVGFMLDCSCCCRFDVVAGLLLNSIHVGVNSSVERWDSSLKKNETNTLKSQKTFSVISPTHLKYVLRDCRRSRG